ncbi:MAG: transcriptional repressor, partial [Candidatus Nanopelagicaceae bacterium]
MNKSETKVLQTLEKVGSFASSQDLYKLMNRNSDSIGLTSVYRA